MKTIGAKKSKKTLKKLKKGVDKRRRLWYNIIVPKRTRQSEQRKAKTKPCELYKLLVWLNGRAADL
ncbi:MAG: hypothetical protein SOZ09_06830 [Eubacteriales bacterium]|nr:hypothetical protein [Clostridiales bacterium]MDY3941684.1 hypothetical protein [Eubacteriales bacterium]